jgi:hypothetical protein
VTLLVEVAQRDALAVHVGILDHLPRHPEMQQMMKQRCID